MDPQQKPQQPLKPTWAASIQQINLLLSTGREIVTIIGPSPNIDNVAAALAFSMSLKKIGRKAHTVCFTDLGPVKERIASLRGTDQILKTLPSKQLSVVIDYSEGTFSQGKIQKKADSLTVELLPEPNQPPLTPINIQSNNYQSKPDTAVLIDAPSLSAITGITAENQAVLNQMPIINIDNHVQNTSYGRVNLIDTKASSLCEMVALLVYDLRLAFDEDIAHNLYTAMGSITSNFSQNYFSANLLEAASICLRYQKKA